MHTADDRRQHPRFALHRQGKVYDRRSRRYISCLAVDVSRGGALIEMKQPIPASPGVHLLLGVSADHSRAIIANDQMMEVEVTRAMRFDATRQFLAVRFVHGWDVTIDERRLAA